MAKQKQNIENLPNWDLSSLYSAIEDPKIKQDIQDARSRAQRFSKLFKDKVIELDGDVLGQAVNEYEAIEELLGKLASYSYLVYSENISDSVRSNFYQNTSESINEISSDLLFFELELNRLSDDELEQRLQSPSLLQYKPWLRDIRMSKPYQLSGDLEKLLHEKNITSTQGWHRLFEETIANMRFDFKEQSLTCAEILNKLSSHDETERKEAAQSIGKNFAKHIHIFTLVTNILAKDKSINDSWRKFKSPISSRNISNLIEDDVTNALISTVENNYENLAHRYYKLKSTWLGKVTLPYWDRNAPLPFEDKNIITWDQAVETVLKAYTDFSPIMGELGQRFFDNNWIDATVTEGKDSGAYSHPTVPSANPFILMNYQGKSRDVMTLAHELGHGVHQLLSAEQGYLMADTPLTLAETASVFGEQLTFRSMLAAQEETSARKAMIASKVEDMLNTVVRQIAFCQFEIQLHDERKNGELSSDRIGEIWLEVQQKSLGPSITFDDNYKHYWAYIPHFIHTPFYVYAYAFGDCLVNSLYYVYQQQADGFQDKYLTMLKAGGTLRHKELLAPFGLDATKADFWQNGLNMISDFIDELEKLD